MSLIEKEYFTLAEVVEGLGMPWTDVIYLAENGHLRLSVLVFQLPVDWGSCVDQAPTDLGCDPLSLPSQITGLVDLGDRDAHMILKNGAAIVGEFNAKPMEYCVIAEEARPQTFRKEDLLLRRCECLRLEGMVKAKATARRGGQFTHSPTYREITINGLRIALGPRQADVVRQLHEAALAGNPWRNGKELLRNAGSESTRMHDLFKSKGSDWSLLIDSDRRGLYRLAVSRGHEHPRSNRRRAERSVDLVGKKASTLKEKLLGAEQITLHKNADRQGSER